MNIVLDSQSHTYTDADTGRVIRPSATGLLKWAGYINDEWFNEYAAERGRLVHLVCQLHNEGDLDEDTIDPVLMPYYMAYVRFLTDTGFKVMRGEWIAYNADLDIVCMPDMEGLFPGETILCVADIKSGAMQLWTKYQTAFQKLAIGQYRKRFGLNLRKNGKYKIEWHNNRSDEAVVLDALRRYRNQEKEAA